MVDERCLDSEAPTEHEGTVSNGAEATARPRPAAQPPEIPGYRILARLGAGGMGEVWAAEQLEPVRREVAVKVVKWGMDTREVIARFESERQALALMDHPAIARVFEAGATSAGRPYFAMELIKGVPITEYCDRNRLGMAERLELFARVCEAVQHAHHKGVIHRDLKPSNVLVKLQDGVPAPKVIDFGLAKATAQRLTEHTVFTEYGQLIGTPEYMSPEQAEVSALDVDTRTDVYSLGVLLYELLVGALPFDPRELRRGGFAEIQRRIREEDPPRPSTRFNQLGDASASAAENRRTEPRMLAGRLKGDLDAIVMKSIEKDRTRRYETVQGLAEDVRCYLRNEPVHASPPSAAYRAGKFVRRHRLGVMAAAVAVAALLVGSAAATVGLLRARVAERTARREAARAQAINGFLRQTLSSADPYTGAGRDVTVASALATAAGRIDGAFADDPATRAAVRHTIGQTLTQLGRYAEAEPLLVEALATRRQLSDEEALVESLCMLGGLRKGQRRLDEAGALFREALELAERSSDPQSPQAAQPLLGLGDLLSDQAKFDEAEPLLRRAVAIQEDRLGPADPTLATTVHTLGILLVRVGRPAEAEPLFERTLAIREKAFGPAHPFVATSLTDLGGAHWGLGEYDEAERYFTRALELRERALGGEHPDVASALHNLATLHAVRGRYAQARELYARSVAIREKVQPGSPDLAASLGNLANIAEEEGDFEQSQRLLERTITILESAVGPDHPSVGSNLAALAGVQVELGRLDQAEPLFRRALAKLEKGLGPGHQETAACRASLAALLEQTGRTEEAEAMARRAMADIETAAGPDHPYLASCLETLAALARRRGRLDEAEPLLRRALAIAEQAHGAEHPAVATPLAELARTLAGLGRTAEAEPLYRKALAIRQKGLPAGHPDTAAVAAELARFLRTAGRGAEAAAVPR